MAQEQETETAEERGNIWGLRNIVRIASVFTAIAAIIFFYELFSGRIHLRTIQDSSVALITCSLVALSFWILAVWMARDLYKDMQRVYHQTADLYLAACKERDQIKSDNFELVTNIERLKCSLNIEETMRRTAETELIRVRREYCSVQQEDRPVPA